MPNRNTLPNMHPVLAAWFTEAFGAPTDVQRRSWEAIASGSHTLIAAPTGSGKTLAALLPCLNRLLACEVPAERSDAAKGIQIVYITPLKALNNDIHHHVVGFMTELDRVAVETGLTWPGIRSAVRTGDTKPSERAAMLRRPPELLVTTPESLYILLTSEKSRDILRSVRQVIVDEIHDLAADKRGAHLSLSLERLDVCCGGSVQRIGVSATQKPLARVARFLGGWTATAAAEEATDVTSGNADSVTTNADRCEHPLGYRPRPVRIVQSDMVKSYAVTATMPDPNRLLQTRDAAIWLPLLERLMALMEGCRSVIIYVNSRRLCERLCLRLNDHVGYEMARAHHGSMSREWRLEAERMLKSGELRCIVATASLELGIDVGHIDYVIQIDPPPEAAAGIQRVGRAGHAVGDTSRGALLARNKGALPDIAVLSRMIAERDIEEIVIPRNALDVLAQQTVAIVTEREWHVDALYRLIVQSDSYRDYPRERLNALLELLSGFYPFVRPLLEWDRETNVLTSRRNTRLAALTGAGTIPQSSAYPLHHAESRVLIGELDEEFVHESRVGDVVQLGAQAWMIREIRQDRVYASEAGNRYSEVPFWRNESPARSYELSRRVGSFLGEMEYQFAQTEADGATVERLRALYALDDCAARELIGYLRAQQAACGLPTDRRIVIEHYKDAAGQKHVHIHNLFGRKINRTWLMAIERQFADLLSCRLYGNAKDNGIELVFAEWDVSWLHVIWQVTAANVRTLLTEALASSPLLSITFRRIAETSLLLARSYKRMPLWQMRLRSAQLLKDALPYAERFPIFQEAMRQTMQEHLDIERLHEILEAIRDGRIETVVKETAMPSPFASQFLFEYVNMRMYEGDGLDESVQLQLLQFGKSYAGSLFGVGEQLPSVDPVVMEEEARRLAQPEITVRDADDILRLLKERGDMTAAELFRLIGDEARDGLDELRRRRKVAEVRLAHAAEPRLICADEQEIYGSFPATDEAISFVVGRYAAHRLSFTEDELRERYPVLQTQAASDAVEMLVRQGIIEQAPFATNAAERIWSSCKVASRLIRLSIDKARRSLEPIDASRWLNELLRRQYIRSEGEARRGEAGLLAIISRLQGLFLPLSHWESLVFTARLPDYRPETLDLLCASGQVVWLGRKVEAEKEGKVAFFVADNLTLCEPWLRQCGEQETRHPALLSRLQTGGASFLTKLSQETGRLPSEVLADLLELVWEGRVSNDQFAPLRQKAGGREVFAKTGSGFGRWYWTGSLLAEAAASAPAASEADSKPARTATAREQSPAVRWVHHLLQAYGVLTKALVSQMSPYTWDELLPALNQLEMWGAVTRGMFIREVQALQFTTRELAAEIRRLPEEASASVTLMSAADPANPYGLIVDWPVVAGAAFSRKTGNYLLLQGERWRYWIENGGRRILSMEMEEDAAQRGLDALKTALSHLIKKHGLSKIVVERYNGTPVLETEAGEWLRAIGAERDRHTLVLWPSALR